MAAKKSPGYQQFPLVPTTMLSEEETREQIYMALNLKDGQKSATQSLEDPYTRAVNYIEKHKIVEVFQNITARLAYEKPEDPIQFVLDEIEKIKRGDTLPELK